MVSILKETESHLGSVQILNQLHLAEVHSAILANNWSQVESVLFANASIAKEVDPFNSQTILHKLCKVENAPLFTLEMLVMLNPMALAHRDYMDYLPIHYACQYGSVDVVRVVCEAYKVSLVERIGGRLPIHVAAEYNTLPVVEYLVEMDKSTLNDRAQAVRRPQDNGHIMMSKRMKKSSSKTSGLPLHFACRNYRNPDIITFLLDQNSFAAAVPDDAGDFPLHIIVRYGSQMDMSAFKEILGASPAVASVRDGLGNFPLATALNRMCPDSVIYHLLEASPLVTAERDRNMRLPIELATNQDRCLRLVLKLLLCDIPIDIEEITYLTLKNHGGSWHYILSSTQDLYFTVVQKVLKRCTYSQIRALSEAKDKHGNTAKDIATPVCLNELNFAMRMCNGTLQVVDPNPAFKSLISETEIYYGLQFHGNRFDTILSGLDLQAPSLEDYSDDFEQHERGLSPSTMKHQVNIKLSDMSAETRSKVIIKATTKRDVFERDTLIRREFQLSPQYVAAILSSHPSMTLHLGANVRKGMHCVVMECADATFENMLPTKCRDLHETVDLLYSVATPLFYLHRQMLIHGDYGPHNIGKFDDQFKLLGVGGSTKCGHFTDVSRGFYLPPEAIRVDKKSLIQSLMVRSRNARVEPVRAYPSFDVWAFGCTMFELLTGKTLSLYSKKGFKQQRLHKIASFTTRNLLKEIKDSKRAIHPQLIQLLSMILDPNPKLRIKSMEGILFRLEGIIGGSLKVGILQRHVLPLQCLSFEQSESVSPVSSHGDSDEEEEEEVEVYDTGLSQVFIPLQEARFYKDAKNHLEQVESMNDDKDILLQPDENLASIHTTMEALNQDVPRKKFLIVPTQELKDVKMSKFMNKLVEDCHCSSDTTATVRRSNLSPYEG